MCISMKLSVFLGYVSVWITGLYLSKESFRKMLLTCSRSYVSMPSDWWEEEEEITELGASSETEGIRQNGQQRE